MFEGCTIYTVYLIDHYSKCLVRCFFPKAAYFVFVSTAVFSMSYFSVQYFETKITRKTGTFTSLKVVFNNKMGKIAWFG